ncbi:hypothetical protein [Umboniibacter marinipuniceus]|uniref:hypothetical protein n=1 Tax=Umboniibacter marinipuniceus TaxID=569599 RepID=UPI000EF9285F|nr:hypothetical protein [Umboniibacter marinipuniceus]
MKSIFKGLKWLIILYFSITIILIALYSMRLALTDWREAAREDINAWHALILQHHPGPVDEENPEFIALMEHARDEAIALTEEIGSRAGYIWAMERYEATYNDPHLGGASIGLPDRFLENTFTTYQWTGFYASLDQRDNGESVNR